ncbi:hypothetical protein Hanom_Chr07g00652071 [Helianthus anomalus]
MMCYRKENSALPKQYIDVLSHPVNLGIGRATISMKFVMYVYIFLYIFHVKLFSLLFINLFLYFILD